MSMSKAERPRPRRVPRLRAAKSAGLILCLFVVLCVLLGSVLKAGEAATLFGALCGTPLAIHYFYERRRRRQVLAGRRPPLHLFKPVRRA